MTDVVVTVPMHLWEDWIAEGDLPGDPPSGERWHFYIGSNAPDIEPGERVYVIAHGRLRGYAPLIEIERPTRRQLHNAATWGQRPPRCALVRGGGAVAVTVPRRIRGFPGWRYRDWDRSEERPFPEWRIP